ncbi:MAG: nitroreductase [Rhizobium sp.]|jgi:nitroreductase|nr:nitroreductase [Rhizobium sp.]
MLPSTNGRKPDHPISGIFLDRWSPRAFTPEPIPKDVLYTIFEAARWAPSAANNQPWHILFAQRGTPDFTQFLEVISPRNARWAEHASVLAFLLSQKERVGPGESVPSPNRNHVFDAGAAWAYLALQSSILGWVAHAIGGFNADAARDKLSISHDYHINIAVAIGKQGDKNILPLDLQASETPSSRHSIVHFVSEGVFGKR